MAFSFSKQTHVQAWDDFRGRVVFPDNNHVHVMLNRALMGQFYRPMCSQPTMGSTQTEYLRSSCEIETGIGLNIIYTYIYVYIYMYLHICVYICKNMIYVYGYSARTVSCISV